MKKQLVPLFILTSVMCIACNAQGQIVGPDNSSDRSEKKSEYSQTFNPSTDTAKLLKKIPDLEENPSVDLTDSGFVKFLSNFNAFSSSFSDEYVTKYFDPTRNDTISPLSIYFAMAQAGSGTAGSTQDEIFNALNISYSDAIKYSPTLYKATNRTTRNFESDEITSIEDINNSLWFERTFKLKESGLKTLVDSFYCEPYAANFKEQPKKVSQVMSDYISDKTRGLIKPQLDFDDYVRLVIVNTLYMKDQWNESGYDLQYEQNEREFINYDNSKTKKQFLLGQHNSGNIYSSNDFTSFYASTFNGFKIRFMLPKEDKKINEIFNKNNILEMHNADYSDPNGKRVYTRCIFPEFVASATEDLDLVGMFKDRGVNHFFSGDADFSNIAEDGQEKLICSAIKHLTKLIVDKKGMEGAAVTIVVEKATSVNPGDEPIYQDFIVDKAFGFEISDHNNIPLFTGIVSKI